MEDVWCMHSKIHNFIFRVHFSIISGEGQNHRETPEMGLEEKLSHYKKDNLPQM